jgi:hypothetical protein
LLGLMKGRSGWVCGVVEEGLAGAGDPVELA